MQAKKKCVAMLLAGGQGSRLGVLTRLRAKPAVPYGGKYKIIDFPLSNCVHSGVDTVGVLTQYQPLELNSYISTGAPWDLDSMSGGAFVLPPYVRGESGEWYSGTANAVFQNCYFIDRYNPDYVIVLSGDHIYKMDYSKMLLAHIEKEADATIAVIKVPFEEASRFGIMNTDEELRIFEFEEKPAEPKNNMASMGVYVFTWKKLRKYLIEDSNDINSANDFGKNVIPAMLSGGEMLFAYPFRGYWKDVGTVESYWEANMELLSDTSELDLQDTSWRIYSRSADMPPHYTGKTAKVKNSIISEGCVIDGEIENSVIFPGEVVEEGAKIKDSIIMSRSKICGGSSVIKSILDEEVVIGEGCKIGGGQDIAVIGMNCELSGGTEVSSGEMIEPNSRI